MANVGLCYQTYLNILFCKSSIQLSLSLTFKDSKINVVYRSLLNNNNKSYITVFTTGDNMTVQRNMARGNRHHSRRLIQSHWEPCLECNSILSDDPVEPTVELFFNTQHVKYAHKDTHKRQRARVEKKKVSLSKLVYLFHEMNTHKKKESQQQTAATVCRHYRLGDNTRTFCFALPAFPILSKGIQRERKRKK